MNKGTLLLLFLITVSVGFILGLCVSGAMLNDLVKFIDGQREDQCLYKLTQYKCCDGGYCTSTYYDIRRDLCVHHESIGNNTSTPKKGWI